MKRVLYSVLRAASVFYTFFKNMCSVTSVTPGSVYFFFISAEAESFRVTPRDVT